MSTRLTREINGKQVTGEFYSGYFKKHFKEISGVDVLADDMKNLLSVDGITAGAQMLVAGNMADKSLAAAYPAPPAEPDITVQEAEDYLLRLETNEAFNLIRDMAAIIYKVPAKSEDKPGEAETQAEQS